MSRKTIEKAAADREALLTEIEHLLMCGEGEHALLAAFNTNPDTLKRRLRRAGRLDLIPRIFEHEARTIEGRKHSTTFLNIAYNRKTPA